MSKKKSRTTVFELVSKCLPEGIGMSPEFRKLLEGHDKAHDNIRSANRNLRIVTGELNAEKRDLNYKIKGLESEISSLRSQLKNEIGISTTARKEIRSFRETKAVGT